MIRRGSFQSLINSTVKVFCFLAATPSVLAWSGTTTEDPLNFPLKEEINRIEDSKKARVEALARFNSDLQAHLKEISQFPKKLEDTFSRHRTELGKLEVEISYFLFFVALEEQTARHNYSLAVKSLNAEFKERFDGNDQESSEARKNRFNEYEARRQKLEQERDAHLDRCKEIGKQVRINFSEKINRTLEIHEQELKALDQQLVASANSFGLANSGIASVMQKQLMEAFQKDASIRAKVRAHFPIVKGSRSDKLPTELVQLLAQRLILPQAERETLTEGLSPVKIIYDGAALKSDQSLWASIWDSLEALLKSKKWNSDFSFGKDDQLLYREQPVRFEMAWLNEGQSTPLPPDVTSQVNDWIFFAVARAIKFPPSENLVDFPVRVDGTTVRYEIGLVNGDGKAFQSEKEEVRKVLNDAVSAIRAGNREDLSKLDSLSANRTGNIGVNGGVWYSPDFLYSVTDKDGTKSWKRWESYSEDDYRQMQMRWQRQIQKLFFPPQLSAPLEKKWKDLMEIYGRQKK